MCMSIVISNFKFTTGPGINSQISSTGGGDSNRVFGVDPKYQLHNLAHTD